MNHDLCVFWVSSLTYPNSLGTKGFVVVVVRTPDRFGLVTATFFIRKRDPVKGLHSSWIWSLDVAPIFSPFFLKRNSTNYMTSD